MKLLDVVRAARRHLKENGRVSQRGNAGRVV